MYTPVLAPYPRASSIDSALRTTPRSEPVRGTSSSAKTRDRKPRTYNVINPRTGEKLTIRCRVPFRCHLSKRLRIVDPRTGNEVLPSPDKAVEDHQDSEERLPARTSICSSRLSVCSNSSA